MYNLPDKQLILDCAIFLKQKLRITCIALHDSTSQVNTYQNHLLNELYQNCHENLSEKRRQELVRYISFYIVFHNMTDYTTENAISHSMKLT